MDSLNFNSIATCSYLLQRRLDCLRFRAVSRPVVVLSNRGSTAARRLRRGSSLRVGGLRRRRRDYEDCGCSSDLKESNGNSSLEADVLKFMRNSEKPGVFPTKKELVDGGRRDLAEAIVKRGGWLSMGWDLNSEVEEEAKEDDDNDDDSPRRVIEATSSPSFSNGSIQIEKSTGIEGILERLEEQRNQAFGIKLAKNKSTDNLLVNGFCGHNTRSTGNQINGGLLEDDDIIEMNENGNGLSTDVQTCLPEEEIELSPTLHSLSSDREEPALPKSVNSVSMLYEEGGLSCDNWQELSDAYEFEENEMMNAQQKLRSLFAKLIVLEKKTTPTFLGAQKLLLKKQRKVDYAQKAVQLIRPTCVIWPNSAFEVMLTGSFDGWTTQRRMKRTGRGDFSVWLKLYPGSYEIKFFVDNQWKIDPHRPIVDNKGFQNNLLIVT